MYLDGHPAAQQAMYERNHERVRQEYQMAQIMPEWLMVRSLMNTVVRYMQHAHGSRKQPAMAQAPLMLGHPATGEGV